MQDNIVTVARFLDPIAAQIAKNRLEGEGIPVLVAGDTTGGAFPGMGGAFNAVHLQVDEEHYQQALHVLEIAEKELSDDDDTITTQITDMAPEGLRPGETASEITARAMLAPGDQITDDNITTQAKNSGRKQEDRVSDDDPELELSWSPDNYARRAWLAAVFGLMCAAFAVGQRYLPMQIDFIAWGGFILFSIPLQVYSAWMLIRLASHSDELSSSGTWKMYGALLALGIAGICYLGMLSKLYLWGW
jgi:hypothetical protein